MSDDLDIQVARALGWKETNRGWIPPGWESNLPLFRIDDAGFVAHLLAEIKRRDAMYFYILALYRIVCDAPDMESIRLLHFHEVWFLLTATPEQHCRAFLAVVSGVPSA